MRPGQYTAVVDGAVVDGHGEAARRPGDRIGNQEIGFAGRPTEPVAIEVTDRCDRFADNLAWHDVRRDPLGVKPDQVGLDPVADGRPGGAPC